MPLTQVCCPPITKGFFLTQSLPKGLQTPNGSTPLGKRVDNYRVIHMDRKGILLLHLNQSIGTHTSIYQLQPTTTHGSAVEILEEVVNGEGSVTVRFMVTSWVEWRRRVMEGETKHIWIKTKWTQSKGESSPPTVVEGGETLRGKREMGGGAIV